MDLEYDGLPKDWLQQIRDKVVNLTKDDIQRAAKAHFNPERFADSRGRSGDALSKVLAVSAKCGNYAGPGELGEGQTVSGSLLAQRAALGSPRWTRA